MPRAFGTHKLSYDTRVTSSAEGVHVNFQYARQRNPTRHCHTRLGAMSEFFPGQRVLCIDGKFHPSVWDWVNEVPIEGEVYTVAFVRQRGRDNVTGKIGPAIALVEISGRLPGATGEVCWVFRRFAPLDLEDASGVARKARTKPAKKRRAAKRPLQPAPLPA